ncbi:MAG: TnsA endonuclease N-terminal domain-containing protein [Anaerolineales bacterium]|nr:TnsA endonuclease N-terminal domain-containing protein [Chloroflexota bacterium]MBL6981207.1 TnsA endonuclease N-terminal domain-containing protein [Anaerolineales bacterium]
MSFKRKPPPGNVRRVISLGKNFSGVTTNKQGHLVQFESEQERKLILLLERDPTVSDYRSQPETIQFLNAEGRQRRYTPDFQVWRTEGCIEWHEVTVASRREARGSLQEREMAARAVCEQRGWCYLVHTDETLPAGYEYANLDFLAAFRAESFADTTSQSWWLAHLSAQDKVHPMQVLAQVEINREQGTLFNSLYHLLWYGVVQMDWQQPLIWCGDFHPEARIWLSKPLAADLPKRSSPQPGRPA